MKGDEIMPNLEICKAIDNFQSDLMNAFIDVCNGNDFNKITLIKIGEIVDKVYDDNIQNYTE